MLPRRPATGHDAMVLKRRGFCLEPPSAESICGMLAARHDMRPNDPTLLRSMIFSKHFDHIAIALSTICIVHCLAVPVLVAVLPVLAISLGGGHFHGLMLWLVVPTSVLGFGLGVRVHRQLRIPALGAVGVAALAAAALWGHSRWSEPLEVSISVAGSIALAIAHWMNFREVRSCHRPA